MRDEKDPGTLEMPLPRRRGRPPRYTSGPMTPAERARRYRQGLKMEARQAVPSIVLEADNPVRDAAILEALRHAVSVSDARAVWELTTELQQRFPRR